MIAAHEDAFHGRVRNRFSHIRRAQTCNVLTLNGDVPPLRGGCFQPLPLSINQCLVDSVYVVFLPLPPPSSVLFTALVTLSVLAEPCDALR